MTETQALLRRVTNIIEAERRQENTADESVRLDKLRREIERVGTRPLSPRLEQTLGHLLEGDSEKQIAYKLKLSRHTVHVYVKNLYQRFDVNSRAELMAKHSRYRR